MWTARQWARVAGATAAIGLGAAAPTAPQEALAVSWYRTVPEVVRLDAADPVRIEVAVTGTPDHAQFIFAPDSVPTAPGAVTYELRDDGRDADQRAGDGVYSVALPAATLLSGASSADANRRLSGFLTLTRGTTTVGPAQLQVPFIDASIPAVEVTRLAADVQVSAHVVNIHDPGFMASSDYGRAYRRFYDFFDDDYYGINVVTLPSRFQNRFGGALQSDATGIGLDGVALNPMTGSGGGLFHMSAFPLLYYFDGAETGAIHELGHQWINYAKAVPALAAGAPHWPVSSLAGGVMGYGSGGGEGLSFPCTVTEETQGLRMTPRKTQPVFTDFDLYLMGLLLASSVTADALVLPITNTTASTCTGALYTGAWQRVSIGDVVRTLGPRVPAAGVARTRFRIATVVVSRDGLVDADTMAWLDYFSSRMAGTEPVPTHAGFVKATGYPFAVATRGLGSIDASVTPRSSVDFLQTVSPSRLEMSPAAQARFTVHLESRNGTFTAPVSFECLTSIPVPRACSFDPPVAVPGASGADVTVTLSGALTNNWLNGAYSFAVRATSGDRRHTTGADLVVK